MKFGIRIPSIKKRIAARTSWKRMLRHNLGLKAPKGLGIATDPKKAIYNKVYNATTVGVDSLAGTNTTEVSGGFFATTVGFILGLIVGLFKWVGKLLLIAVVVIALFAAFIGILNHYLKS